MSSPLPVLEVHVERGRSALRVVARSLEPALALLMEATFLGQADGVSFRLTQQGITRLFSRDSIARHPALSAVLRLIADEVELCPGGSTALSKPASQELLGLLCHSLLVYVQRMGLAAPLPCWGRPLGDARVERALELLNADIARRWTVELLARSVGLSRPAFARQFLRVLGLSPMRYLTQRRLQVAAALLLASDAALAEVAARVGYHSEFAFSRAFRKQFQVPPGVYRQRLASPISALGAVPIKAFAPAVIVARLAA